MKDLLRPYLSSFRWFRHWYGGKWGYWRTSLPMRAVWLAQWERPGCGEYMIEQEDWSSQKKRLQELTDENEHLRTLIRRVIEWQPSFPVESSLLDELATAARSPAPTNDNP
jgi:hypothetical protein